MSQGEVKPLIQDHFISEKQKQLSMNPGSRVQTYCYCTISESLLFPSVEIKWSQYLLQKYKMEFVSIWI